MVAEAKGCLAEDVNKFVRHCFTLDQQQKITKSKYVSKMGYAVLDKKDSDNIINAAAGGGIYDVLGVVGQGTQDSHGRQELQGLSNHVWGGNRRSS